MDFANSAHNNYYCMYVLQNYVCDASLETNVYTYLYFLFQTSVELSES